MAKLNFHQLWDAAVYKGTFSTKGGADGKLVEANMQYSTATLKKYIQRRE